MQRLRIRFSRGEELRFISHLDLMRLWQRALTRAGIDLAYSEGYSPHPRLSIAAPLALGVTSEAELMDIFLEKWASPHFFTDAVNQQMPEGIRVMEAHQIPPILPSLQSRMSFAEYEVKLESDRDREEITDAIADLLSREEIPWQHQRDTGPKKYDLRKLIDGIRLEALEDGTATLLMKLRCDSNGSGRPEQVAAALGFAAPPHAIARTNLVLKS